MTERRVKIVATLGPASNTEDRLVSLIAAGVDMFRINAAHGSNADRAALIANVRRAADARNKRVPILFDLQGLKIRTGPTTTGEPVNIARGSKVRVYPTAEPTTVETIGVNYPGLLGVIQPNSRVLISDGLIELLIEEVHGDHATANVSRGGPLHARQGVTLPGAPIKGGSLTDADRLDLAFAVEQQVDYLGLSFINDASDLVTARNAAAEHGDWIPGLIAKIERPEALNNLRDIARHADGVMVARGDLGVQLPPERVPRAQKEIIRVANQMGLPVITATQMLESMINQPVATRAETSDVANAVWDGTDAVMLSAESAIGKFPLEAVSTLDRIIREVEKDGPVRSAAAQLAAEHPEDDPGAAFSDGLARAAYELAKDTAVKYIVVFTKTGNAVRRVAKYRPKPPIVAVADDESVARKVNLVWGVDGVVVPIDEDPDTMFRKTGQHMLDQGIGEPGDYVLIVGSLPMTTEAGRTNLVHFRRLGE
jgi:pyruvate kinase